MRFSYALLGIALLNGCQITGQKDTAKKGSINSIHQSAFFVNHKNIATTASYQRGSAQKQKDVWDRIAMQLKFPVPKDKRVAQYRDWYLKHPQHLRIVSQRARPFLHLITERIEARGIPLEIALLPIVESSFDQFASSHVKAAGLWQFVPDTARRFGLEQTWWYDGRRDVVKSTEAALDLLEYLHKKFDGNWLHALAAYNTGEGRVFRAIRANEKKGLPTDFWSLRLPKETSAYVPKLIAVADVLKNRHKYGIEFQAIANKPAVKLIKPDSPIDLELAAKYANISPKELHKLNPAYNRLSATPNGIHQILLPVENVAQFYISMANNGKGKNVIKHQVKSGDALIKIAKEYQTTVATIRQANNLMDHQIRIGQKLRIPVSSASTSTQPVTLSARAQNPTNTHTISNDYKIQYTIAPGDSLWSIAKTHQISYKDLADWNNMESHSLIHAGKKLTIFTKEQPSKPTNLSSKTVVYQIQTGDSLSTIAYRYNVTVKQLLEWNSLDKNSLIKPGQELKVHLDIANQA